MARKRWYAFSGIVDRQLNVSTEVRSTAFQAINRFNGQVEATFATREEALAYQAGLSNPLRVRIITETVTTQVFAPSKAIFTVPLVPLPVFDRPGKILATRGFWDVASTSSPRGNVSNFAFGMIMQPVAVVFERIIGDDGVEQFVYEGHGQTNRPDPLLDDPGWFAYDSFVRVTTDVNQDPPFYSRSHRKFPANSALQCMGAIEVGQTNLTSLAVRFGIRFRMLIES